MAEKTCPRCSMAEKEWKGGNGRGVDKSGQTFCCDVQTTLDAPAAERSWGELTSLGAP